MAPGMTDLVDDSQWSQVPPKSSFCHPQCSLCTIRQLPSETQDAAAVPGIVAMPHNVQREKLIILLLSPESKGIFPRSPEKT